MSWGFEMSWIQKLYDTYETCKGLELGGAAVLLPEMVRVARQVHRGEVEMQIAVVTAWAALAGTPGWSPEMVDRVQREMSR